MKTNFHDSLENYRLLVEEKIKSIMFERKNDLNKTIIDAMEYSLLNGGKRIRAFLTLETCKMFGGNIEDALNTGVAIEMLHAYSLIHDDLPSMDNDDMRRGIPSCHIKYGEAMAILAGDGLQTLAFEVLSSVDNVEKIGVEKSFACIGILSHAIGENGMLGGQVIDVLNENKKLSQNEHLSMVSMKTAALIVASVHVGAICGGASKENLEKILEFGFNLGVAFQIKDDILDIIGDAAEMGKKIGGDEKKHKNTFPALYGAQEAKNLSDIYHKKSLAALDSLKAFNYPTEILFEAANFLSQRNF